MRLEIVCIYLTGEEAVKDWVQLHHGKCRILCFGIWAIGAAHRFTQAAQNESLMCSTHTDYVKFLWEKGHAANNNAETFIIQIWLLLKSLSFFYS